MAELVTPIDEVTGLPLLVAPRNLDYDVENPNQATPHHGWHPERDKRLNPLDFRQKTLAGLAVRSSRLQYVENDLHNEGPKSYHAYYDRPEWFPQTETEAFGVCMPACMGAVTSRVIDLSTGEPIERPITPEEIQFFQTPSHSSEEGFDSRYVTYRYDPIRDFFRDYIKRQDLGHVPESLIDEFLNTRDYEAHLRTGRILLASAVEVATDPVRGRFHTLRHSELIMPGISCSYTEPGSLVYYKLGNDERRDAFITQDFATQLEKAA